MPPESNFTRLQVLIIILIASILASCSSTSAGSVIQANLPRQDPDVPQNDISELVRGDNAFALDLYQAVNSGEENLFFSPYSLSQALAMVYAGAGGETESQMADVLHFNLPQDRLHPAFNALDLDLQARGQPAEPTGDEALNTTFELKVANAVWGQQGASFRPEYLDLLAQSYGAGLRLVDFKRNPAAAVEQINHWVNEASKDRIPRILSELDPDTALVLANAIYFNALWAVPFDESLTQPEPFYLLDGSQVTSPLMHQTAQYSYSEGPGYQAIVLPYTNPNFAMLVLLPEAGKFADVEQGLSNERVQGILDGMTWRKVILSMPKYRLETSLPDLTGKLSKMGMPDAFLDSAEFPGVSAEVRMKISEIVHKAFIEVTELDTEAAAASIVEVMPVSTDYTPPPPVEMRIDRPFIFLIRDHQTGAILFIGRVINPKDL